MSHKGNVTQIYVKPKRPLIAVLSVDVAETFQQNN